MQCRSVLTRIDALRTGELHPNELGAVREHLRSCRSCDESAADVSALAAAMKSLTATPLRSCCNALADGMGRVDDIWVAFSDRGLRMLHRGGSEEAFRNRYAKRYGRALEQHEIPETLRRHVTAAAAGELGEKARLDLDASELESAVYLMLMRIPRGEVRTYSWLAEQVGRPRAVRAVANFVARNIVPFVIPCHRVVPASGGVGKYAFGSSLKRELLRREGVDVDQLDALAKRGIRFIGSRTTNIVCFPTCRDARRIREENRIPFHAAAEALSEGFRPCRRCQPFAA